ncbi:9650_t:CDS:2 [Paraglomus occultum]|uniref:9650_t:CDS:1 n=1 Tax=Paraglomus occultum TaxID=144539 RepID=A0A9N9GIS1_9GLOM|nr:9650_t:CDS:2 [Paraglomus occultum]
MDVYTPEEWHEYCKMPQVRIGETPAKKLIRFPVGSSSAPEIGIAICFSCDRLVYTGQRKKNIGNYNHIETEKHWKFSCTGNNNYCGVNYEEYLKIKQECNSGYYDNKYALHRYELWKCNAIGRLERAREIGKKIQRKIVEYLPALMEKLYMFTNIRAEMRCGVPLQISNVPTQREILSYVSNFKALFQPKRMYRGSSFAQSQ